MTSCCVKGCSDKAEHLVEYESPETDKKFCMRCAVFHYRRDALAVRCTKLEHLEDNQKQ